LATTGISRTREGWWSTWITDWLAGWLTSRPAGYQASWLDVPPPLSPWRLDRRPRSDLTRTRRDIRRGRAESPIESAFFSRVEREEERDTLLSMSLLGSFCFWHRDGRDPRRNWMPLVAFVLSPYGDKARSPARPSLVQGSASKAVASTPPPQPFRLFDEQPSQLWAGRLAQIPIIPPAEAESLTTKTGQLVRRFGPRHGHWTDV
jgi:hypothetical protein